MARPFRRAGGELSTFNKKAGRNMKRSIEAVLEEVKLFKANGLSTFQAMAATMKDQEWDDLITLIDRLQRFWKSHADKVADID